MQTSRLLRHGAVGTNIGARPSYCRAILRLGESGLAADLFETWAGEDGMLTIQEWNAAVDARVGEQAVNFAAVKWDGNGDGRISREEFRQSASGDQQFAQIVEAGGQPGFGQAQQGIAFSMPRRSTCPRDTRRGIH